MELFFLNIGRWIWSKFSIKSLAIVVVVAILSYGAYQGYHAILERGIAMGVEQQAKITAQWQVKAEKAEAQSAKDKAKLQTYVSAYDSYVADTKKQQQELAARQAGIVKALTTKIAGINQQLAKAKELNRDIGKYISPANDVTCIIPTGMLLLYNQSLQDSSPAGGFLAPSAGYAFAPSGVSCSTFAGYFVGNNAEAVKNRSLLIQWQTWYQSNQAVIQAYLQANQGAAPPPTPVSSLR